MASTTIEGQLMDAKRAKRRRAVESGLDNAITTIDSVVGLVPSETAQKALKSLTTLLTVIRNTTKNQQDFDVLADDCRDIALTLWQASSNASNGELSRPLMSAIEAVQVTVDRICSDIEEKAHRNIASKLFHAYADKEDMLRWTADLAKCIETFNTKLNVIVNVNVMNMSGALDDMRSTRLAVTNESADALIRHALPQRPTVFFGRDGLVQQAVQVLLRPKHVAFLGPGGMGKSSLAKAVLSDPAIVREFGDERYFVPFDDLDSPGRNVSVTISVFFTRLATALGLRSTLSDPQKLVMLQLQSRHALIVLDSAETFLHGSQDAWRIAAALDDIAANPSVTLLFTSRSASLPPNLLFESFSVPPLDPAAAREAFSVIYNTTIDMDRVQSVLAQVDFHPLSVTLLAQASRQNAWGVADIEDAWREHKTRILQTQHGTGAGRNQNIAVCFDLTLKSTALQPVQPSALHFLQLVAFFPPGLHRKNLKNLCPQLADVESLVALLCRLSITFVNGDFVTMLAPIRIHILETYGVSPTNMPLFDDLRTFYRRNIKKYGMDVSADVSAPPDTISPWYSAYILTHELALISSMERVDMARLEYCYIDCYFLLTHMRRVRVHYRPLQEKLLQLQDHRPRALLGLSAGAISRTNRIIDCRAECIVALGNLAFMAGDPSGVELFDAASRLKQSLRKNEDIPYILLRKGLLLLDLEQYTAASAALQEALKAKDRSVLCAVHAVRGLLAAYMGDPAAGHMAAAARLEYESELRTDGERFAQIQELQGRIALLEGNDEAAQQFLRGAIEACQTFPDARCRRRLLVLLATISARHGDTDGALCLINEAKNAIPAHKDLWHTKCTAVHFALAINAGDFNTAHALLLFALSECSAEYGRGSHPEAFICYRYGQLGLISGDLEASRKALTICLNLADAWSDIGLRARAMRVLGELNLVDNRIDEAISCFNSVRATCEDMGLQPQRLYYPCPYDIRLPDRFGGWEAFLEGHLAPSA